MPAALRRTLVLLLTVAAALLVSALPATARAAGAPGDEATFVTRMNDERRAAGLATYSTSGDLTEVARRHAQRMADRGQHFHNSNLANEVSGWVMLGENVGRGGTVEGLHQAFMSSPSHRANILRREFSQVGVGVVRAPDGRIYVVEVFRQPRSASAASAPAPQPAPAPAPAPAPQPAPAPAPAPQPAPAPAPAPTPTTVPPAPATTVAPAPTTTVPPTTTTIAATPDTLGASALAAPVVASVSTASPTGQEAGPAVAAAGLIVALLAAHVVARRRFSGAV